MLKENEIHFIAMATIGIMVGGALLNATAFVGGNYLAKSFLGDDGAQAEKVRHDKSLEAHNASFAK